MTDIRVFIITRIKVTKAVIENLRNNNTNNNT